MQTNSQSGLPRLIVVTKSKASNLSHGTPGPVLQRRDVQMDEDARWESTSYNIMMGAKMIGFATRINDDIIFSFDASIRLAAFGPEKRLDIEDCGCT